MVPFLIPTLICKVETVIFTVKVLLYAGGLQNMWLEIVKSACRNVVGHGNWIFAN